MTARPVMIGDHRAWLHDEGHPAGTFTTFDALDTGAAGFGPRKVHVFVPRSIGRTDRPYPLVLLHDGDTSFWPGGVGNDTWDVAGTLSSLRGRVREAIAVAVHPVDRNYEYTHVDWADGRGSWGGLPAHADYLADGIVPFLRAHWPIEEDPRANVIVGSSHGGLASFWTATRRPDVFGSAACLSSSFFSGLDALADGRRGRIRLDDAEIVAGAADVLADAARRPRLWLDWGGRRDGGAHNAIVEALAAFRGREMADLLVRRFGYRAARWPEDPQTADLIVAEAPAHGHDEAAWRERLGWALLALIPAGQPR